MSRYPANSTARQYHDADGNPITLYRLVRAEPDWAASRIQAGEAAISQRDELLAALKLAEPLVERTVDISGYKTHKERRVLVAVRAAIAKAEHP